MRDKIFVQLYKNQSTPNKLGTVHENKARKEPKNNEVKEVDVKEKQVFNFKFVQTALSTIDITTTKSKYYEMRSKSQIELSETTNKQEVGHEDLHQEVTEWFEIHSDKVRVKLWGEKMKKLAEKLKKPGGEEKLRSKIEKFMKQAPETYTEVDNDIVEFRKQLPNNIVQKLKKMYSSPKEPNVNIYRLEKPKYCSRYKIDNFKNAVLNWTKTLSIKKKDFLGRNVKKDDVFKFVAEKLEPVVLDRPKSDSEYKEALQSSITEIVYELPIAISSHNRDLYLNKAINNLVEKIFTIENKFSGTYIQPTTTEIKEFVKDEITFFLEKCRVAISTKRMEYLEIELVNRLLDLTDITDIDSSVADDVTKLLKEVSKLPEYKAKYFTNLILKDYKEFFFRESFFQQKGNSERGRPEVYSTFQIANDLVDFNEAASFETYKKQLVEEISKWLTKLSIPTNDKNVMKLAVNDLAGDIVDRYKYLLLNPSLTGKDAEELKQLKFQIFKWTNKLIGETTVLEHAQELMNEINNIPKPSLQDTSVVRSLSPPNTDGLDNTSKSYIDKLTDEIYDWYCELSVNFHVSQDTRHNKMLIKELAEEIEKGFEKNEDGVIDNAVRKWAEKIFNKKLSYYDVQQLKSRINNVPYTRDSRANELKHEKNLIRSYEDIVDEWIDKIPIEPIKLQHFISNKNEIIHSLAVKIFKFKSKLKQLPAEVVEKKIQEELSNWLKKKLPLHVKVDNQNDRDKYATKLAKSIQRQSINDFLEKRPKLSDQPVIIQLENVVLDWLRKLPLYREKSPEERQHQETAIKGLALKLSQTIGNDDADLDKEIFQQIRMLDPEQNEDNVQNTAFRLKQYLQKLDLYKELCKQREEENKLLVDTIEVWLKDLALQIIDVEGFHKQKADFIKSVKKLISSGSDNAVTKKEILVFTKTLPMSHSKKHDFKYLNTEVSKLVKSLNREPIGDVASLSSGKSNEMISDAIKVWSSTLPLQLIYCPKELNSVTDDLCSVITSILLDPDQNSTREQNYARLYREIVKFLRRLPLIYELSTETHIFGMAAELSKSLKNISLFGDDTYTVNNMTVYDVSVKNNTNDHNIEAIGIYENLETYTDQLVQQISEWFDRLYLPEGNQDFKVVAINDLASDIVDRHKYLGLNPNNNRSEQDEIEHLKYQIFKWINKLVGEENKETIAHAEELMKRVKSIPVPMLVRPQDKDQAESHSPRQPQCCEKNRAGQQSRNAPTALQDTCNRMDPANPTSKPCCSQEPSPAPPPPEEGSIDAMCQKFLTVFTDHCNAIPLDDSTPYAKIARQTIVNGILLTFFKLKADPLIENDYRYFEFLLEGKIDKLLDELPQTEALQKMRHSWKTRVLESALGLLNEMHSVSDRPSFRQNVKNNFNRQLAIDNEIQNCFVLQQNFLNSVADAYILQVNYKEKDPVKANIYRNRLMGEVDKLVNHLTKEHNAGFRGFNQSKLRRIAMKALEEVPVPANDILQDEVEEIHIADEIEKWYKELPTKPSRSEEENVAIKRMIDLLAKKLNDMHKHLNDDNLSMEDKMKHEVSHFLVKRKTIQDNYDHKITDMVDLLFLRLKDRWAPVQDPAGFDEFAKAKPLSSTLAHVDNAEFLAPLMNAGTSTSPQTAGQGTFGDSGYFIQPGLTMQDMERVPFCSLISPSLDSNVSRQVRSPRVHLEGSQFGPRQGITQQSPQAAVHESSRDSGYFKPPNQNMASNVSRQVSCSTSQGKPNEGYTSLQGATYQSMQAPASPARGNLEGSPFGRRPDISQQTSQRPNLSQQVQNPRQVRPSPKTGRGTSQGREQSINQSLRQDKFGGQMEPQDKRDQKTAGQVQRSCGTNGNVSIRDPTPRTAEAVIGGTGATSPTRETRATGAPVFSDEDVLDSEFRVKCRCLEAYRRMKNMDYDERSQMFRNLVFPY